MDTKTLTVDCSGRPAEVEIMGAGPDVIFVGTAVPMAWTRPAALELAVLGYRVTNFDYGSGWDDPLPRTALEQVPDVLAVMDAAGVAEAALAGLSRGAMTAFGLASDNPARVSSLILAFPVAGWADTMMIVDPDPEPEPGESEDSFMQRMLGRIFSPGFLESRAQDAVSLVTTPPGAVVRVDRSEETVFDDDIAVDMPVLILEGSADQVVKAEHPARYKSNVPEASHVVIQGAAHGWLMEQPTEFARLAAEFLS